MTEVYTDAGLAGKNPSAVAAAWAWVGVDADGEVVEARSGLIRPRDLGLEAVSSNLAELFAILKAFESLPAGWSGTVFTDSKVSYERVRNPRGANFRGVPDFVRDGIRGHVSRVGEGWSVVQLQHHPTRAELAAGVGKTGRPVSKFNVLCDRLCHEELKRCGGELKNHPVPDEVVQEGLDE